MRQDRAKIVIVQKEWRKNNRTFLNECFILFGFMDLVCSYHFMNCFESQLHIFTRKSVTKRILLSWLDAEPHALCRHRGNELQVDVYRQGEQKSHFKLLQT